MTAITAFITANAVLITGILSLIVAIDNVLAQSSLFTSNSTMQAILAGVKKVVTFVQNLMGPKPPAAT